MLKWCTVTKAPFSTSEAACKTIENQMHYVECECSMLSVAAVIAFHALSLPLSTLCRIAEIGRTITGKRADCLYMIAKKVCMLCNNPRGRG